MGRRKMHSEFSLEYLKKRAHLKNPMRRFEDNIKMTFKEIMEYWELDVCDSE